MIRSSGRSAALRACSAREDAVSVRKDVSGGIYASVRNAVSVGFGGAGSVEWFVAADSWEGEVG